MIPSHVTADNSTTDLMHLRAAADTLFALQYDTWNFGDSVAFEALLEASAQTGDAKYMRFAQGWVRAWATRAEPFRRRDCTAPGSAIISIYRQTGDAEVLVAATKLARYLMTRPTLASGIYATWVHSPLLQPYGGEPLDVQERQWLADPPAGAFIDCLHFDPPFLTALGQELSEQSFVDAGIHQALAYVERLQQPSGLFHHFELDGVPHTFGAGWGRGQGWALLGLLDVIANVGNGDSRVAPLLVSARALAGAMVARQHPTGHWGIDLDDVTSDDEEFSTAAFMAVGLSRMVRRGLLLKEDVGMVRLAAQHARAAVIKSLSATFSLPVSVAVMASTRNSHYAHVPNGHITPWGQGPLVLMLAEELA